MEQEGDEAGRRIAELEADRRKLVALSIGYDQLLEGLVRSRRYRVAQTIGKLTGLIPRPIRSLIENVARTTGAKAILPIRPATDRTDLERTGLQHRLHSLLFADASATTDKGPSGPGATPPVSVVSALYNSQATVLPFVAAFYAQNYGGSIDIVLVDDASSDDSASLASTFASASRDPGRTVRVIRNDQNLGNCLSRNIGVAAATGDIVCILDADCIVNEGFVAAHVALHEAGRDVVIGPMGIETLGQPVAPLMAELLANRSELQARMRLQDPAYLESAINCVTRNLSVTRRLVRGLGRELFDPRFTYRSAAETGYGWEDVEMGAALRRWGARMGFTWDAVSIHMSHKSSVPDRTRALGSARNFALLVETHPHLLKEGGEWARTTVDRIASWVRSTGADPLPLLAPVLEALRADERRTRPICVYSASAGGYEPSTRAVDRPLVIHRLFSDSEPVQGWESCSFDEVRDDPVRTAKKPKILPHIYLEDCDWSIWMDSNITLLADPRELVVEVEKSGHLIGTFRHPERDSLYDEALRCISAAKDDPDLIHAQISRYRAEGYPTNHGLAECNVLVRRHSDPIVAAAMRRWWDEIEGGSRRDQISFNYALWRTGIGYHEIGEGRWNVRNDPRFHYKPHTTAP